MRVYSPKIKIISDAVRKCSRKLARDFGELENLQVSKKGTKDFVTSADLKAEQILIEELQKSHPEYSVLSEESGFTRGENPQYCWIIDPLDGTSNFMHGFPFFCTTVALAKVTSNDSFDIIAGMTHAPILGETFYAEKNIGAWIETNNESNSKKLMASSRREVAHSLLSVGSFSSDFAGTEKFISDFLAVRCLGSTALSLAYLAAGRFDCFIHKNAKIWDLAAGHLIVKEAKGHSYDVKGGVIASLKNGIVATNSGLNDLILNKINSNAFKT